MDGHQEDPFHWEVDVIDASGRDRTWKIGSRDGEVVSVTPPGEGFIIPNWRYAAAALNAAGERAELQRTEKQR